MAVDELAALRAEVRALTERIAQLERGAVAAPEPTVADPVVPLPTEEPGATPVVGRRALLGRAGGVVAGAVVGGTAMAVASASPAAAASGSFDGNPAVSAVASPSSGTAIEATTASGTAVTGTRTDVNPLVRGAGVLGEAAIGEFSSPDSVGAIAGVRGKGPIGVLAEGMLGVSATGDYRAMKALGGSIGVEGRATLPGGDGLVGYGTNGVHGVGTYGVHAEGTAADLLLAPAGQPPRTRSGQVAQGALTADSNGDLWYCVEAGDPGRWQRIAGPLSAGGLTFLPAPVRVLDTRSAGVKPGPAAPFGPVELSVVPGGGPSGVPTDAVGALVSLTVVETASVNPGWAVVYAWGAGLPGTSSINWFGGNQTLAVTTVSRCQPGARLAIYAGAPTHVIVDVIGYYG